MAKASAKDPRRADLADSLGRRNRRWRGSGVGRFISWQRSIWRRRWLSLATAWAVCCAGWLAVALWPTSYMSSAVIYADIDKLLEEQQPADGSGPAGAEAQAPVALLKTVLLSDPGLSSIREQVGLDGERARSLQDEIMLRATAPPVFVAAYEHKDPATAQRVLQTLLASFNTRIDKAASVDLDGLNQEILDQERQIDLAASRLVEFRRTNAEILGTPEARIAGLAHLEEDVVSLQGEIERTIGARDAVAEKLAQVDRTAVDETVADEATDEPAVDRQNELNVLETELADLRARYADTHPYVVAVVDAVEALKAQAAAPAEVDADAPGAADVDAAGQEIETLKTEHEEHSARLSTLNNDLANKRREIDRLQALTATASSVEVELSKLETDKKDLEEALGALIARRDEAEQQRAESVGQASFRLINEPNLPTEPTGPSRLLTLALVLLGGLGLGAGVAVLRNHSKGVFESAWQLKQRFDVGVLGTISEVLTPAERKRLGHARLAFGLGCLALVGLFSGLAIAESRHLLAPLGDRIRIQLLG